MNWKAKNKQQLVDAFLTLSSPDEVRRFLRDLLTEKEIEEFAKRFQAAELLSDDFPYTQIEKETGLSSTTIARVSKFLNGKEGGYALALNKLHHHTSSQRRRGLS
jgi:TrpR-related protein YerC/YecD